MGRRFAGLAVALLVAALLATSLAGCSGSGTADGADGAGAERTARAGAAGDAPGAAAAPVPAGAAHAREGGDSLVARADSARVQGNASAAVWIVEISDFQCPYCRQWHAETYEPLRRELVATGRARLAYVNFPLPNHRNARPAAEAAMCAGAQRKFWEMHDGLFASQSRWAQLGDPTSVFDSLATSVGLDARQYRQCVRDGTMRALVQGDFDRAVEAGVNSTPTFIIDNRIRLQGAHQIESFRAALDSIARSPAPGG